MNLSRNLLLLAFALVGCSSSDRALSPEPVGWPARETVEQLVPRFDEHALRRVDTAGVRHALATRLSSEASRSWNARLNGGIKYADLLLEAYEAREFQLSFATPDGQTVRAQAIMARLERSEEDALDPSAYHFEIIAESSRALEQAGALEAPSFALTGDEAEIAVDWLETHAFDEPEAAERAVIDAMFGFSGQPPLSPRLSDLAQARREQTQERATAIAELEVRVADAALRFARDMKHFNYRRLSWRELEEAGGGKAVVYSRLRTTLGELEDAETAEEIDAVLTGLRPDFEQYDLLLESLKTYRAMTPWPQVEPGVRDAGLRERLAAEGYAGELNEAIEAYQRAHQFEPGPTTAGFWRSLNVSHDERVRQIELTLQRYRETFYRGEPDYIFVNIPSFTVDIYREHELQMRKRVVVGNTERVCDTETNRWRYPNATPVQWAMLDHLELNPWWNVPSRLFTEEIAPRADDEAWLQSKGYELFEMNGATRARQRPGPNNALGLVKFIFPNPHNTYLHDTPHKQYFDRVVRTFSHGCVRLERPLELAEYLMTTYDKGGADRLNRIMELGSTIRVEFEERIPVFFEHYTVQVDEHGRTLFLADPYQLDAARLDPDHEDLSCAPTTPAEESAVEATEAAEAAVEDPDDLGP